MCSGIALQSGDSLARGNFFKHALLLVLVRRLQRDHTLNVVREAQQDLFSHQQLGCRHTPPIDSNKQLCRIGSLIGRSNAHACDAGYVYI